MKNCGSICPPSPTTPSPASIRRHLAIINLGRKPYTVSCPLSTTTPATLLLLFIYNNYLLLLQYSITIQSINLHYNGNTIFFLQSFNTVILQIILDSCISPSDLPHRTHLLQTISLNL